MPVGLTRFRPGGDGLKPVDRDCARKVIHQVEALQRKSISHQQAFRAILQQQAAKRQGMGIRDYMVD